MSYNFKKKIPETCRFWREGKCQKGEYQCNFVHGFICPNDGRCWKDNCNRLHFNQKNMHPKDHYAKPHPQNYQRGGHRPRYRRSRSRSQSPPRYRKVFQRGRSPPRRRSRSRSPGYHTRAYSPYHRRSRSHSSFRGASRSLSPARLRSRSRSKSWRHSKSRSASRPVSKARSPSRIKSRSSSPIRSSSKSHITTKGHNKSHSQSRSLSRSPSPKPKKRSSNSSSSSSTSSSSNSSISKERPKSRTEHVHPQSSSPSSHQGKRHKPDQSKSVTPVPVATESEESSANRNNCNAGRKMQLDLENIYADLECETNPLLTATKTSDKDASEKEALSKLQAHIARDFMNPETQKLMEQVLSLTKEKSGRPNPPEDNKSKKDFILDEVGDDIELDLEEVGEEVDDIFAKSLNRSMDDSNEDSFDKGLGGNRKLGLQAGSNPSPPKSNPVSKPEKATDHFLDIDFHTDWDLKAALETASKSLKKPSQMPPPDHLTDGSKMAGTSLWTPALARQKTQAPKNKVGYQIKDSDWEVETPYVGRKDKSEVQRSAAPPRTALSDPTGCDVSPSIPFALPMSESQSIHRNSQESIETRMTQQTEVLFPSAQSIPSNTSSKVSYSISQPSKLSLSSADHAEPATSTLPPCTSNLIRDAANEKDPYHSPKEGTTAPKKVSEEQPSRKSSESPKRSKRKRRKEKKPKRKKGTSDEDTDSSESEGSREDRRPSVEDEIDSDEVEVLLFKRESLMKRVKLLVEQKAMMSSQREDIISNHKGSKASLSNILEENSFLTQEIGKQIGNVNNIIKSINKDIEAKRGRLKQKTVVSKESSKSPRASREMHKTSRHSSERERTARKVMKPNERSESYKASPCQKNRSKSPFRKTSRSPSPVPPVRHLPPEAEQKRSPKGFGSKRSRSPSASAFREAPKPVPPPEVRPSGSPPRKRPIKSVIEVGKKPAGSSVVQQKASKNMNSSEQYAPHEAQRTYIRYIDQGMHWCKLCTLFCETAPEYVSHLMTESHLARVKNDRKSWLSKGCKEEKDPRPPNAQVLTVPIQGLEFLHSLPCYYCSLCDTFLRDKGEAIRHPESKMHVSKYKVHRAQNPLFESTFLKAKTTAYAKYKIDEERKKMESELNSNEKVTLLENKLKKQIKEKLERESKDDQASDSRDDSSKMCGSIRVASRGPRYSSDKKPSTTQPPPPGSSERHSRETETRPKSSDSSKERTEGTGESKAAAHKSDLIVSERNDNVDNGEATERGSIEGTVETNLRVEAPKDGSKDTDTDRKVTSAKLPLIGKMPFLKRKGGMSKSKEQQSNPSEEASRHRYEPKEDSISESLKIPLPCSKLKDINTKKILGKTCSDAKTELGGRELPATSARQEEKLMPPGVMNSPSASRDVVTHRTSDGREDTGGSAPYDPHEAADEDSSDCAAAATIEALDLLNIPLPGFKTATDVPKLSTVPLPPETEDVYQPEDMEIDNTPVDEDEIGGGIEEVYQPSGIIVHPDIPLPPPVRIPPPPLSFTELLPPGTEEAGRTLDCKIDVNAPPGNMLPVLAPQEFIANTAASKVKRKQDPDTPVPPGTEDEYKPKDVSRLPHLSGQSQMDRVVRQKLYLGSGSPSSSSTSKDATPSFSGKILGSAPVSTITALKMQQKSKQPPCRVERTLTPPPPGTESLPDEKEQLFTGTANSGAVIDVEVAASRCPAAASISSSVKNNSNSTFVKMCSSLSSASNKGKPDHSQVAASENVQEICMKNSFSECLTSETKNKEQSYKSDYKERPSTRPPEQPNTGSTAMSPQPDKTASPSADGNSGFEISAPVSLTEENKLDHPKALISGSVQDDKKDSSSQCLTVNRDDERQESRSCGADMSDSFLPEQPATGDTATPPAEARQTSAGAGDSQDSGEGSASKECLPDEQMHSVETIKDDNECCDVENETIFIHSRDDRHHTPLRQGDTASPVSTPPHSTKIDAHQEPSKASVLKECMPGERDGNSSNIKESSEGPDSGEESVSKECLPDEEMHSVSECFGIEKERVLIHSNDDARSHLPPSQDDIGSTAVSPTPTPLPVTAVDARLKRDEANIFKECVPDEQGNNSSDIKQSSDSSDTDEGSASEGYFPDEHMFSRETTKDDNECFGIINETILIHSGGDKKCHVSPRQDNTAASPAHTPPPTTTADSVQDPDKASIFEECMPDEQDNISSLKDIPEDSNEYSCIMSEKGLTLSIDMNEEHKSEIIKCGSPLQFVNFPKGFESMDIADLYSPSVGDSTCVQSIDASETEIHRTKNYSFSVSAENIMGSKKALSETLQESELKEEDSIESDVKEDQNEAKSIQEASCSQTVRLHDQEADTDKVSNKDHDSFKSKDVEGDTLTLEYPIESKGVRSSRREVQTEEDEQQEAGEEDEESSVESPPAFTDDTDSKSSAEELACNFDDVTEEERKSTRKTTRKSTTKVEMTEDDECTSPRSNVRKSSSGHPAHSFVESPRPMRSSRKAAAAAIKAMAKDEDETPPDSPDSPSSESDTDYSESE